MRFEDAGEDGRSVLTNHGQQAAIHAVEAAAEAAQAPLQRIEHELHTPVALFVIPLFAPRPSSGVNRAGFTIGELRFVSAARRSWVSWQR